MRSIVKIHHEFFPNKRLEPTLIALYPNYMNIIKLGEGDRISEWPFPISNTTQKEYRGKTLLKVYMSSGNSTSCKLLIYEDETFGNPPIALAVDLYSPRINFSHLLSKHSNIFKKQYDRPPQKMCVSDIEDNVFFISPKPTK
jgi:hypothetical protein